MNAEASPRRPPYKSRSTWSVRSSTRLACLRWAFKWPRGPVRVLISFVFSVPVRFRPLSWKDSGNISLPRSDCANCRAGGLFARAKETRRRPKEGSVGRRDGERGTRPKGRNGRYGCLAIVLPPFGDPWRLRPAMHRDYPGAVKKDGAATKPCEAEYGETRPRAGDLRCRANDGRK